MQFDLTWSSVKEIVTAKGLRRIQEADPTAEFWAEWRVNKDSLKNLGITVGKKEGNWVVTRWLSDGAKTDASVKTIGSYTLKNSRGLLEYQIDHTANLISCLLTNGFVADASDTGTGKTYCAIVTARELGLMPAIVCPKSVIASWQKVCDYLGVKPYFIANWEACKSDKFLHGEIKTDKNTTVYKWKLGPQILLIFDEAHKAKGDWTLNCHMVVAAKHQRVKMLLCSATLASNPNEMRAVGYALGLHNLKDYNHWRTELGCYQNKWNGWEVMNAPEIMKTLSSQIFPAKGARLKISDLGDKFPETQISAECYNIGDIESKRMNARYNEMLDAIEKLRGQDNAQAKALLLNLRYRQFAEAQKVKLLIDLSNDYIEDGKSVVIFTNFTETLEAISSRLKCPVIYGQQSIEERQAAIDEFQSDKQRVICVNIAAGGAGVSLHDLNGNYSRVALLCPTYRAIDLRQALGRIWRAGGVSKSIQRLVYAAGTIEEEVSKSVNRKIANINALNDGDLYEKDVFNLLKNSIV